MTNFKSCAIITSIHKEELSEIHSITAEDNIRNLGKRQSIVIIMRFRVFLFYLFYMWYKFIKIEMGEICDEEF